MFDLLSQCFYCFFTSYDLRATQIDRAGHGEAELKPWETILKEFEREYVEAAEKKLIDAKCANKGTVGRMTLAQYEEWVNNRRTAMEEQKQRIRNLKRLLRERKHLLGIAAN